MTWKNSFPIDNDHGKTQHDYDIRVFGYLFGFTIKFHIPKHQGQIKTFK